MTQKIDKKILHIISNETKSSIDQMQIVTPTLYASIFAKYAKEHNQPLEDEVDIAHDLMQAECENFTDLQSKASQNAMKLSDNTDKAISAIQNKDENILGEVLRETKALKSEIEKLKEAVYKDELTHAYNRKWLHDTYLEPDSDLFKDDGTLLIIDLNYFKQVNDTHGHIVGDKVLMFIANELNKSRSSVIRYGGDEFIILFHKKISLKHATEILHEIREKIIHKKLKAHDTSFRVSFSYGGCQYTQGDRLSEVIALADKVMYQDKIKIKKRITGI